MYPVLLRDHCCSTGKKLVVDGQNEHFICHLVTEGAIDHIHDTSEKGYVGSFLVHCVFSCGIVHESELLYLKASARCAFGIASAKRFAFSGKNGNCRGMPVTMDYTNI